MLKKASLALAIMASLPAFAASPASGDLAFTSFNADEDGWSMATFINLSANTTVYFTDNEWDGVSAFNTGESYFKWTSGPADIAAGTVIRFSNVDNATTLAASSGTLAREAVASSTNYGLSQTADTIYAYLGSSATAPTVFLSSVSSGTYGTAADGSLANTGLSIGNGAVQLSASSDYAEYNGARSGLTTFAAYKPLVSDVTKWTDLGDGVYNGIVPNTTAFVVANVPEPEGYAMALAGLLGCGFMLRRSRQ